MPRNLLREAPLWTGAAAVYADRQALRELFTWRDRDGEPYPAYRVREGRLYLPREVCPLGEDRRVVGAGTCRDVQLQFEPRSADQARAVAESRELLLAGTSHIMQASTGTGKTAMTCPLIHAVGRRTLVVVTQSNIFKQWLEEVPKFLPGVKVGQIRQDTCDVAGKDVVVGMLHSMCKVGRYPKSVLDMFGLVVFDEVHRMAAEEFSNVGPMFPARLRLGLSAESSRYDGKMKLVRAHCGDILVRWEKVPMRPKVLVMRTGWNCPGRYTTDGHWETIPHEGGKDAHVVRIMSKNLRRNRLVAHLVGECWIKRRSVVVFSHRRDHLETLEDLIKGEGIPRREIGYYVGRTGKGAQAENDEAARKKVVLATYQMAATGTNCPWWDACIMATPVGSPRQPVGRVLRGEVPGKPRPVIIDLVDSTSPLYTRWAERRLGYYESREVNAEVVELAPPDL
jgi:superfamily II DNA or RNA helicase